jgi:hydroxymethylpyrimidine pyrophosphatase-like HAD family hydrolase
VTIAADIRLVATDLDGTLLRHDGSISDLTRTTLAAVEASGRHLVFVTGRPPRWMPMVVESTGHRGIAVCGNGAVVIDLHTMGLIEVNPLTGPIALEAAARLREAIPGVAFAAERVIADGDALSVTFSREEQYRAKWPTPDGCAVAPLESLLDGIDAVKVLARVPQADDPEPSPHVSPPSIGSAGDTEVDRLLDLARSVLGDLVTVTHSNPNDTLLEISAAGVSKATALARLADERGVDPSAVVAFGDQPNDLPMLAWAGRSFAVANAHPAVLAAVDGHAPSVDDDGVARTLRDLLGL